MSQKLNEELIEAIRSAVIKAGSQAELARRTGTSQGNITKYLLGQIHTITDQTFHKLKPFIEEHLKEAQSNKNKSNDAPSQRSISKAIIPLLDLLSWDEQMKILDTAIEFLRKQERANPDEFQKKITSKQI